MESLSWYIKRFSVMERGEAVHRLVEQARVRWLKARQGPGRHPGVAAVGDWRHTDFCAADPVRAEDSAAGLRVFAPGSGRAAQRNVSHDIF